MTIFPLFPQIIIDITMSSVQSVVNNKLQDLQTKIIDLRLILEKDIAACDIKWSLFVAAAQSYRYHSRLNPYPPKYATKEKSEYDIDRIKSIISSVPSFRQLLKKISDNEELDEEVVELVHWVICSQSYPTLRSVAKNEVWFSGNLIIFVF